LEKLTLRQNDSNGKRPIFFLSYARMSSQGLASHADPNYLVGKLFDALSDDVMALTGSSLPVGFMDRNLLPGDVWTDELAEALANCQVFVPLYSRHYFNSEHCGKEWAAFARRTENYKRLTGDNLNAIVPALFTDIASESIPQIARAIQYRFGSLNSDYNRDGFYGIMKRRGTRRAFRKAVYSLAKRIVDVANSSSDLTPAKRVKYSSLTPAFGHEPDRAVAGTRVMRLAVTALDASQALPSGRSLTYYGASAKDWRPYEPASREPACAVASDVLASNRFEADAAHHEDCHEALEAAQPTAPGLLLVDPWATLDDGRRAFLNRLDALNWSWIRAVIPWGEDDQESKVAESILEESLKLSLPQMLENASPNLKYASCAKPRTVEEFWDVVGLMARAAEQSFLKHAPTNIQAFSERPKLEGPGLDEDGD
jgi:FxsC-like protein